MKKLIFFLSFIFATFLAYSATTDNTQHTKYEISQIGKITDHSNINTVTITHEGVQRGELTKCSYDLKTGNDNHPPLIKPAEYSDYACLVNYKNNTNHAQKYRLLDYRLCNTTYKHSTVSYTFKLYLITPVYLFKRICC